MAAPVDSLVSGGGSTATSPVFLSRMRHALSDSGRVLCSWIADIRQSRMSPSVRRPVKEFGTEDRSLQCEMFAGMVHVVPGELSDTCQPVGDCPDRQMH